ncbi:MAG: site-specific integrase [Fusobacterium sp.]|nr:site-specific integrase [Fusobacterium sp.]
MAEIKERIRKNGKKSYTASVRIKGHPAVNKTFAKKTDAEIWANAMEIEIKENMNFPNRAAQKMTVGDLIDRFLKYELPKKKPKIQKDFIKALNWYKNEIGCLYLLNIQTAKLVECRDKLSQKLKEVPMKNGAIKITQEKISPATVNRYMTYMRVVFSYAVNDLDILAINPMAKVKKLSENNERTRCLELSEIQKLLDGCNKHSQELFLCVLIALLADARKSEILNLTWQNVDLTHKMFYFLNRKNKQNIGVPIHDYLYKQLLAYKQQCKLRNLKNDYLFMTEDGKPKETLIGKIFPKVAQSCGIENFRFHDLRHTGASWQAMSGISQPITQRILGHKSPSMTNRYSHLRDDGLRPAVNQVGDILLSEWLKEENIKN